MKKIDLHIHTVPTFSDSHFTFSLDVFKRYVAHAKLDAVAITNHDIFDANQFREIRQALSAATFPGIEINLEKGHILLTSDGANLEDFEAKTALVSKKITKPGDNITVEELLNIFGSLDNYLVIPHYDKRPSVTGETLEKIKPYISAGEVDSAKKFIRALKDNTKLTPVLFSDVRIRDDLTTIPTRQTYIDCGDITLDAIKSCLKDKGRKVTLSEKDGNKLWQIFEDGQQLSTGLNVLLGARSSGKTYTLDKIFGAAENVKYIKQFSLVQKDDATDERDFNRGVQNKRSTFIDSYLFEFKNVLEQISTVNLITNNRSAEQYVETLLRSAEAADRQDAFSKTTLFNEVEFPVGKTQTLIDLIRSVRQVIENVEYKAIVDKHLSSPSLKALIRELIELLWSKELEAKKMRLVNELVNDVKNSLKMRTSSIQIEDVDLYKFCMDNKRVSKFNEIAHALKKEKFYPRKRLAIFV